MASAEEASGASNGTPNGTPEQKPIPAKQEKQAGISLTVKAQDGTEVVFKVKPTTPFEKLFTAYCNKKGVSQESVRFLFDGNRIRAEQTPAELARDLGLEDGDMIDVVIQQVGGCRSSYSKCA